MNINLHIERLVLDGISFSHVERLQLQAAIETELTRLLSSGGVHSGFQVGMALPAIRARDIHLTAGSGPDGVGQQIAGALYGEIGK